MSFEFGIYSFSEVSQAEILEIEKEGKKAFLSVMVYRATNLY